MDNLINLLNHKSNFTIVTNTNQRQVIATNSLTPGDIIGPSDGLPAENVLDPVEILKCSDVAREVLSIGSSCDKGDGSDKDEQQRIDKEKMAFWIALAVMGREAEQRQQQSIKKRKHADTSKDHTTKPTQQQVHDAYLLSLPKEGPDPCCWSKEERDTLLQGTPLSKQINTTLKQIEDEYNRVAKSVDEGIKLPPFSINGQGIFPSVLWARSMHISRSFPRSLIDEEGVWWQGRKKYQPPSESVDTEKDSNIAALDDSTTVLSVRLGGYRAPIITTSSADQSKEEESKPPPQPSEEDTKLPSQPQQSKQHTPGANLGILIPLMDMFDHKNAHPVQWESVYNPSTQTRSIRFRSCVNIKEGDELYNNYGPKGNLELLATYGFAIHNNVLDSVEGIVLGISIPNSEDDEEETVRYQAQVELVREYDMPHRIDKDKGEFGVLFLGPFSLHRKLPSSSDHDGEDKPQDDSSEGEGVIPDELYRALSIIGLENVEEGPMVSIDEMEILKEVLTKKLEGFGTASSVNSKRSRDTSSSAADQLMRVESVEAYKDGQRRLLQLALAELDSLMLGNGGDDEVEVTT